MISLQTSQFIQNELLSWYYIHRRDLPWRQTKDPYKIWVSEIMLQQTRVDTVIPYYNRFIEQFPTLQSLAEATEDRITKAWEGLGYYSRVHNLHAAAKKVLESYNGIVPSTLEEISALKGVGPYTAGAILSIAYNKKVPAVDGNVMRVFSRLFSIHEDITLSSTRKKMESIAYELIPEYAAGDFNQALMELGATVCVPSSSVCLFCPLMQVCVGYAEGKIEELPVKTKKEKRLVQEVIFVWIVCGNRVLVEKRPERGLLAGLSGFPTIECMKKENSMNAIRRWSEEVGFNLHNAQELGEVSHIFSHRHWKGIVVRGELDLKIQLPSNLEWVDRKALFNRTFPVVYQKVIKAAFG